MFKTNSEVIKIEAKKIKPINTGVVFWSHDRGTAKLKFKLMKDNLPQPIPDGTTVPIRLTFSSPTAEGGIGKHDYLATIEDKIGGIVSITLQDNILGYQGIVHGSIYMDFPGDTSLDTAGRFSFEIQRSPIDETTPELEDYYFNGFSKVIDQVEKLIDDTNKRIDGLNTEIDKANGTLDRIEDEIKESSGMTEKFINSLDFGNYDYSGNPNIAPVISDENVKSLNNTMTTVTGHGTYATAEKIGNDLTIGVGMFPWSRYDFSKLTVGKQYTLTIPIRINADYTGDISRLFIRLRCLDKDNTALIIITSMVPNDTPKGVMTNITATFNVQSTTNVSHSWYVQVGSSGDSAARGTVDVGYEVKLEEGPTATPYQPNLLDAPYYLSNVPLGENLCDPTVKFPITSSVETLYSGRAPEDFVEGETYTVTIGATKPSTQSLGVYLALKNQAIFKPVEGLPNTWTATLKIDILGEKKNAVYIYQSPKPSVGACQIDWLKIEKGDTRTPNIDHLRYKGIGVTKNSINKYLWEENTLLEKVYTNSIDFGDYDYSGNPNLSAKLNASSFSSGSGATVLDEGDEIVFTLDGSKQLSKYSLRGQTSLVEGKEYTISCEIMLESDFVGDPTGIRLQHAYFPGGVLALQTDTVPKNELNTWQTLIGKRTIDQFSNTPTAWYPVFRDILNRKPSGKVRLRNIKIEEGSTATPYQPNLLDAPYYLSKVPLGENIADPAQTFPIKTSSPIVYHATMKEPFVIGESYTITLKGTKPLTQVFRVFNPGINGYGNMSSVEGLTDVWSLTFTPNEVSTDPKRIEIIQTPTTSVGSCQIDWLKIEKGDTRTPNISDYKYIGEKSIYSNDYKNINWDVTEDYIDNKFNIMVDTINPQAIGGTKNFLETPFVNGKKILIEEKPLPYEAWHSTGTEQTNVPNKARLIIGPVATTIGTKLNRSMKENPLTWNSGNWQATVNRDCTLLVEGLVRYQFGGSTAGQYGYIIFYKDDAQTSSIGFAGGVGVNGTSLQWKQGLHFGKIFNLKKGEYFNITFETQNGKKLDFSQINTLHIMEIES